MTMVRNKSLDKLKKKGRNYLQVAEQFELASSSASPFEKTVESETISRIQTLIKTLPENQRSVIVLRDVEGFSYEEISEILDMNLSQVKVNLHRGRKQVRTQMIEINSYGT